MDEDEVRSRNDDMMKRFLEGTLNVGSSLTFIRCGETISFELQGREKRKFEQWWHQKGIHVSCDNTMRISLMID